MRQDGGGCGRERERLDNFRIASSSSSSVASSRKEEDAAKDEKRLSVHLAVNVDSP